MTVSHQASALQIPRPPRTPWLAVAGAKGGVGKTMLATNLAVLLARAGHRTLLVDFDAGCGNVAVHLRLQGRRTLDDVAERTCALHDAIADGPGGMRVLLGRSGSTVLAGDDPALRDDALRALAVAACEFDVIVIDTGAGIGPATLAIAERADLVLSVTTPDAVALTDAYALCKVLHHRGHPLPRLVVNRVKNRDEAMRTATKLAAVARKFLTAESTLCGWVAHDALVELSIQDQRPLALCGASSGQGQALDDLRSVCAAALAALPPLARRGGAPKTHVAPPTLRSALP